MVLITLHLSALAALFCRSSDWFDATDAVMELEVLDYTHGFIFLSS